MEQDPTRPAGAGFDDDTTPSASPPFSEEPAAPEPPEPSASGYEQPWAAWSSSGGYGTGPATEPASAETGGGDEGATWHAAPEEGGGSRRGPGGLRMFVAGALVGALVGALTAGGLVFLNNDDNAATTTAASQATPPAENTVFDESEPMDIQGILAVVQPAVVSVRTEVAGFGGQQGEGAGSGFIISADGTIVTNAHVVAGAESIEVDLNDGTTLEASVVGTDVANDIAVLDVDADGLPVVKLGDSTQLAVGDEVLAIGNALGLEGGPSVTSGIVSAVDRSIETDPSQGVSTTLEHTIQTDAAINRGNSGGPLVNARGEVVGINTAIADPSFAQNVGFAIAVSEASPVIQNLEQGTFLGVQMLGVEDAAASGQDVSVDQGAVVEGVEDGSPAADAGIEEGDVIVEIDGNEIADTSDVSQAVLEKEPGDQVTIVVDRNGDRVELEATLGSRNG